MIIRRVAVMGAALAIVISCSESDSAAPVATPVTAAVETTTAPIAPPATVAPAAAAAPTSPATPASVVTEPAASAPDTVAPPGTAPPTDVTTSATDEAASTDWFTIVDQLSTDFDRLGREVSMDLVERVCAPDSECFEQRSAVIDVLAPQGLHLEGGPTAAKSPSNVNASVTSTIKPWSERPGRPRPAGPIVHVACANVSKRSASRSRSGRSLWDRGI